MLKDEIQAEYAKLISALQRLSLSQRTAHADLVAYQIGWGKLLIGWNDREGIPVEPRELRITEGMANLTRIEFGLSLHARAQFPDLEETPTAVFTLDREHAAGGRFELLLKSR